MSPGAYIEYIRGDTDPLSFTEVFLSVDFLDWSTVLGPRMPHASEAEILLPYF